MKKIISVFVFISIFNNVYSQAVKDDYYYMGTDTIITNLWDGSKWTPSFRVLFSNNAQCLSTVVLSQVWQSNAMAYINQSLDTVSFASDNQITEIIGKGWDETLNSWVLASRSTDLYNALRLRDSIVIESYQNANWIKSSLFTFSYNNDETVYQILIMLWTGSAWLNVTRSTFTYNGNNTLNQILSEIWSANAWVKSSRISLTYNGANKIITSLGETWINNQWKKGELGTNTYDNNQFLVNTLGQSWNANSQSWVNNNQSNYTNNANGTVAIEITQTWDTVTNTWLNEQQTLNSYSCDNVLPLTLINFQASEINGNANLSWKTAKEINSQKFIIQRSYNGIDFTDIGTVDAHGRNLEINSYSYIDKIDQTKSRQIFYRLKMIDYDGNTASSKIVAISIENYRSLSAYNIKPNPAHTLLNFTTFDNRAEITIADLWGRVLTNLKYNAAGDHQLNISFLPKGTYLFSINTSQGVITQKLLIE